MIGGQFCNRAPVALPFGLRGPGDLAQQEVVSIAFLAQVFSEILSWQNVKEFVYPKIGEIEEKVQCSKFSFAFLFIIYFQKIFSNLF